MLAAASTEKRESAQQVCADHCGVKSVSSHSLILPPCSYLWFVLLLLFFIQSISLWKPWLNSQFRPCIPNLNCLCKKIHTSLLIPVANHLKSVPSSYWLFDHFETVSLDLQCGFKHPSNLLPVLLLQGVKVSSKIISGVPHSGHMLVNRLHANTIDLHHSWPVLWRISEKAEFKLDTKQISSRRDDECNLYQVKPVFAWNRHWLIQLQI